LPGGGFRHDEKDPAGPYLGDTFFMGRAFLTLYAVTADRAWLGRAERAVQFISTNFKADIGYITSAGAAELKSNPQVDENVGVTRLANLLHQYTGKAEYNQIAEHAMRFLSAPGVADPRGFLVAGILLADREIGAAPLHLAIAGRKSDPAARVLFAAALKQPVTYKRVEWWDQNEGALPNPDVQYPELQQAAAFLCTDRSCSAPIFSPDKISSLVRRPPGGKRNFMSNLLCWSLRFFCLIAGIALISAESAWAQEQDGKVLVTACLGRELHPTGSKIPNRSALSN
jgi:uncharacterized protein YyaL (SSP411 family)